MSATSSPASARWAYSYDPTTREYMGPVRVLLSPLDGDYPLPGNVVLTTPTGSATDREQFRLTQAGDGWEVVPDYRGVMVYEKATAQPVPNTLGLGDGVPDTLTTQVPTPHPSTEFLCNRWDNQAGRWVEAPDYSRAPVWLKATADPAPRLKAGQPLPAEATSLVPPRGVHVAALWVAANDQWKAVPDYRGTGYWTPDGTFHLITDVDVMPPDDALYEPPVPIAVALPTDVASHASSDTP